MFVLDDFPAPPPFPGVHDPDHVTVFARPNRGTVGIVPRSVVLTCSRNFLIAKYYGTFRKGYVDMMRDGVVFGEKRLFSMCEALEIFPVISRQCSTGCGAGALRQC